MDTITLPEKITLEAVVHNNENRIRLLFNYNKLLIDQLKNIEGARWSATMHCWHVPDNSNIISGLLRIFKGIAFIDYSALKNQKKTKPAPKEVVQVKLPKLSDEDNIKLIEFRKWMVHRRYSVSTINTYIGMMGHFLRFIKPKESSEITSDDMVRFVNGYIIPRRLSYTFQNQVINAAKLFFSNIYKTELNVLTFERPRREHRLPNVLSRDEVKQIIEASINVKHRVILSLIYACGLRRSELLNLKPIDIDSHRRILLIRQSKGKKDRIIPISIKIIEMLREYYRIYKPSNYLFEGQANGEPYSASSMQKILREACARVGIKKPVTLHWLRHSYATHLLESGTDLRFIQEILGHRSSKTTEIYTHVSIKSIQNIKSPFDDL
jgi:integrase/recombinase XerD